MYIYWTSLETRPYFVQWFWLDKFAEALLNVLADVCSMPAGSLALEINLRECIRWPLYTYSRYSTRWPSNDGTTCKPNERIGRMKRQVYNNYYAFLFGRSWQTIWCPFFFYLALLPSILCYRNDLNLYGNTKKKKKTVPTEMHSKNALDAVGIRICKQTTNVHKFTMQKRKIQLFRNAKQTKING